MDEIITKDNVENMIYEIRGKKVMLDSDLAQIYGYSTKRFNEQIKNNIDRFDIDFRFQLTKEEYYIILRSKNSTLEFEKGKYSKYLPYVFTESGIYMLMTVLKGNLAIKQSKLLIRTFKTMKDYFNSSNILKQEQINNMVVRHENEIILFKEYFTKLSEKAKINTIFFDGQIYDAYSLLLDILSTSKKEIIIIDNYAGKELLDILKDINKTIIIVSSNINNILKGKYEKQYTNVKFINNNTFHDRFIIIDKSKLYSCGASFKDLGKKCFSINEIESNEILNKLLSRI